jgi:molecular chaperone DnaK (HSP70)
MLALISLLSVVGRLIAVDLGTEYLKMAELSLSGEPLIVKNKESGQIGTPSALAFKKNGPFKRTICANDLVRIEVKTGAQAVNLVRRNSSLGYAFLPRTVGRAARSEFHTSVLANATECFAAMLKEYVGKATSLGTTFVIPQFWTNEQRSVIADICRHADIQLLTIVDDFTALSLNYARTHRIAAKGRYVLFVDVGATSVKAYAGIFTARRDDTDVKETAMSWSEASGGHYFTKAIAQSSNVSYRKAERILFAESSSINFSGLLTNELEIVRKTIAEAFDVAQKVRPVDEVQVVGGASRFSFVKEVVTASVRGTPVLREFNAQESIALGGVIGALQLTDTENEAERAYTAVDRLPFANMTLQCGSEVPYCIRNRNCQPVLVDNSTGCEIAYIVGPREHIPDGTPAVLGEYELTNLSQVHMGERAYGRIEMLNPDAVIGNIKWCVDGECHVIANNVHHAQQYHEQMNASATWIGKYLEKMRLEVQKAKDIAKIADILKRLKHLLLKEFARTVIPIPEEALDRFKHHFDDYSFGKMLNWPPRRVTDALDDLEFIQQRLQEMF